MSDATLRVLACAGSSALFDVAPEPFGVVSGADGTIYFGDISNHRIFAIDARSGAVSTIAGNGQPGNSGDGGAATDASIAEPYELRLDTAGNLYFVDMLSHVVRRIARDTGRITTVAGCGEEGFSGDDGPAVQARLAKPHSIALDAGQLYIADLANHRVRVVSLASGRIATLAGTGAPERIRPDAGLDGNPLNGPRTIAFEANGRMVLGLREGNAVYRVDLGDRTIRHVAGNGHFGYAGDGADARQAELGGPKGSALAADGSIVLADTENHAVRRIDADGRIHTLAGNGEPGDSTDPREACLDRPHGVYVEASGRILIGDSDNRRLLALAGAD